MVFMSFELRFSCARVRFIPRENKNTRWRGEDSSEKQNLQFFSKIKHEMITLTE